jgi:hypothetical protein
MNDTATEQLRLLASLIVESDAGRATIPDDAMKRIREVVANAAPNCTPEQIANGECPKA